MNSDLKIPNNNLLKSSEDFLRRLTSKFVFYNEKLNFSTAKLIAEVCRQPNIEEFIGKSLRSLLEKEIIIKGLLCFFKFFLYFSLGTQSLAIGALHKNLLYEEFLYIKFKNLVYSQMRKEHLRRELLKTIVDFTKTDYAISVSSSQFAAALRNRGVVDMFVDGTLIFIKIN